MSGLFGEMGGSIFSVGSSSLPAQRSVPGLLCIQNRSLRDEPAHCSQISIPKPISPRAYLLPLGCPKCILELVEFSSSPGSFSLQGVLHSPSPLPRTPSPAGKRLARSTLAAKHLGGGRHRRGDKAPNVCVCGHSAVGEPCIRTRGTA